MTARDSSERRASNSGLTEIGRFPLLAPPPMHSANLKVAMCPAGQPVNTRLASISSATYDKARFIPRCFDCIRDRFCTCCHRWWCESCYTGPWASAFGGHGGATSTEADLVSNSHSHTKGPGVGRNQNRRPLVRDGSPVCDCGSGSGLGFGFFTSNPEIEGNIGATSGI